MRLHTSDPCDSNVSSLADMDACQKRQGSKKLSQRGAVATKEAFSPLHQTGALASKFRATVPEEGENAMAGLCISSPSFQLYGKTLLLSQLHKAKTCLWVFSFVLSCEFRDTTV